MTTQTVINISPEELKEMIREVIREETKEDDINVVSRTEACNMLDTNYTTISNMVKDGRLKAVIVGKKSKITISSIKKLLLQ